MSIYSTSRPRKPSLYPSTNLGQADVAAARTGSATLDFPNTLTNTSSELTIAVKGAQVGDTVILGTPAAPNANSNYNAYVSRAGVVTVRFNNYSSGSLNPASGVFNVTVIPAIN